MQRYQRRSTKATSVEELQAATVHDRLMMREAWEWEKLTNPHADIFHFLTYVALTGRIPSTERRAGSTRLVLRSKAQRRAVAAREAQ